MFRVMIARWKNEQVVKRERELAMKLEYIRYWIQRAYCQDNFPSVGIHPVLEANKIMERLGIKEDNEKVVNFYYKKFRKFGVVA